MKRKVLSLLLVVTMLAGMFSVSVVGSYAFPEQETGDPEQKLSNLYTLGGVEDNENNDINLINYVNMDSSFSGNQEEAFVDYYLTATENAFNSLLALSEMDTEGDMVLSLGYYGRALLTAVQRQPELADFLNATLTDLVLAAFEENGEEKSLAIALFAGSLAEACARQPEAKDKLTGTVTDLILSAIKACEAEKSLGIGYFGKGLTDACARQPEAIDKMTETIRT